MRDRVYVMRDPDGGGAAKIGFSSNLPARWAVLRAETGLGLVVEWASKPVPKGRDVERVAHALLVGRECSSYPVCRSEWFNVTTEEAKAAVLDAMKLCKDHGKHALAIARRELQARRGWIYERR